jgi:hypothetical protein
MIGRTEGVCHTNRKEKGSKRRERPKPTQARMMAKIRATVVAVDSHMGTDRAVDEEY